MKTSTKTTEQPKPEQPKAVEAITAIANVVLAYRAQAKPTLSEVARLADRAAGLLRLGDDKAMIANAATIEIARAHGLVS